MEIEMKILQLEREMVALINNSGLPLTVIDLMLDKFKNQLDGQIKNMVTAYNQEQQQLAMQQTQEQIETSNDVVETTTA